MGNILNLVKINYRNIKPISKELILTIIFFVVASTINPMFLNMMIPVIVLKLSHEVIMYENKNSINNLIGYLPVTRSEYVLSKFIVVLINLVIGISIFTICYFVSKNYTSLGTILLDYRLMLSAGVFSSLLGMSLLIPCILQFGYIKGRIISILIIVTSILLPTGILTGEWMISIVDVSGSKFVGIVELLNRIGLPVISIVIGSVVIVLSLILSRKIYENKEFFN